MPNTESTIQTRTCTNVDVKEPPLFKIIYLNDEKTAMDFVIDSLIEYFGYDGADAEEVAVQIHEKGSAVVAVLPYEIAEQKGIEITFNARSNGYPLQIKLEPDR